VPESVSSTPLIPYGRTGLRNTSKNGKLKISKKEGTSLIEIKTFDLSTKPLRNPFVILYHSFNRQCEREGSFGLAQGDSTSESRRIDTGIHNH
jgi:hypothetical protein